MHVRRSLRCLALSGLSAPLAACSTSSPPSSRAEPVDSVTIPACGTTAATLGAAPLRRLTRFEYGRTVHDLTGVAETAADELPPDEKSLGFEGLADTYSVSTLHAAKYLEVAEGAARALVSDAARLSAFAGCNPLADEACVEPFVRAFGRRAFRRSLAPDETNALLALYGATRTPGPADGVSAVVATVLEAPQFLYRPEPAAKDAAFGPALATRLSFMLVAAAPDAELLDAAESGELDTQRGLLTQADRLLATPRAGEAFAHFVNQWWDLDGLSDVQKDTSLYRTWTKQMPAELGLETSAFLDAAWRGTPSLATLLAAPYTFVDATLASFYGVDAPAGAGLVKVELGAGRAAGLFTQGSFLAIHAKPNQTSPVLRGKFVRERLLCDPPAPPPPDLVVRPPTVDPRLSTRERYAAHTENAACAGCHSLMDPIGFAFEHFDAAGRYRDVDAGKPVDASGYLTGTDVDGSVDGVQALADKLLSSEQVRTCVARQWFRHAFGRDATTDADTCTVGALASELARTDGDVRAVMRATVEQELFRDQRAEANNP